MNLANVNARVLNLRIEGAERGTYAYLSVFRNPQMREGRASLAVFTPDTKGAAFEAVFSRSWMAATKLHWADLLKDLTPGAKVNAKVTKTVWGQDKQRKTHVVGTLVYGIDKSSKPYIGVMLPSGTSYKIPLRTDLNFVYDDELAATTEAAIGVGDFLSGLDTCRNIMDQTLLVPAEQGDRQGGGGFNRGGGNRGGGGGGYNRGGGGGGSSAGGEDIPF